MHLQFLHQKIILTFQYDFDFFLGKKRLTVLNRTRCIFKIVEGVPEEPEFPKKIERGMLLARYQFPPYVLDIDDITFKKTKINVDLQ